MYIPTQIEDLEYYWHFQKADLISAYTSGQTGFVPCLLPSLAVKLSADEVLAILSAKFGQQNLEKALEVGTAIAGPHVGKTNGKWLRQTNMIGINVRTIGSFWSVVKYALTLSEQQNSVHLLPIWEPGVVASLYGMASWNINPEFYSAEWQAACPTLDTVEKQLAAAVNLLHLMGKSVGMDVIPHTDRYSEIVLANPNHFEWLQRIYDDIVSHDAALYRVVQNIIHQFVVERGPAVYGLNVPWLPAQLFDEALAPEPYRMRVIFGEPHDYNGRLQRREALVQRLYKVGLETVPATMAPPYRGIEVDPDPTASVTDEQGRVWRDYRITQPEKMSRVFGPLTRFHLYAAKNDRWELDFERPRTDVWAYTAAHYAQIQQRYNFDFMRGDMSHVQMQPEGVPKNPTPYYDLLRYIKRIVAMRVPYFGYFAESFLAPDNVMAYGNEAAHLEASEADSTLGDLQSEAVGTTAFIRIFRTYLDLLETQQFAPNFTTITADKDDPRFDAFYLHSNELRQFIALFLPDMPSYAALGFEQRDLHPTPAPNEHYTKLYVFKEREGGPKSVTAPYVWGQNGQLFANLTRLRIFAEKYPGWQNTTTQWHTKPDINATDKLISWSLVHCPNWLFVVNLDPENDVRFSTKSGWHCRFSSLHTDPEGDKIGASECRIYERVED